MYKMFGIFPICEAIFQNHQQQDFQGGEIPSKETCEVVVWGKGKICWAHARLQKFGQLSLVRDSYVDS
jgi:hypothetical protein